MQEIILLQTDDHENINRFKQKLNQGYTVVNSVSANTGYIHYILEQPNENKTDQTDN